MNTVHVLLANSNRRLNNLAEVALRDACYEHVSVECATIDRLADLLHRGCVDNFDLIVVAPDHLVTGPPKRTSHVSIEEVVRVIRTIKAQRSVPIIAVGVHPSEELSLLEAGVDNVFGIVFARDELRTEVRRVLNLSEQLEEPEPSRWSFAGGLLRGLQKLRQA
jgi:DNA-binding response OmpR family regulator